MKHALTLLTTLLPAPLAVLAQAKPEVANASKAAKRAWESVPAEKKALWLQQREALKHVDLSDDTNRQVVIARGSPETSRNITLEANTMENPAAQDTLVSLGKSVEAITGNDAEGIRPITGK